MSILALSFLISNSFAYASAATWQTGASIVPTNTTEFSGSGFQQSLQALKADHANTVSLIIPLRQSNEWSTDVGATYNTPTDASLAQGIQYAHSLGLAVVLKPHVSLDDGQWRALVDPSDRAAWFAAYDTQLKHYASIAQANKVEQFVIGTELIDMTSATHNSSNTQNWYNLIADVRALYSGQVGYAANWGPTGAWNDEKDQIAFWDRLDFAGIDAYYSLNVSDTSVQSFENAWDSLNRSDITPFAQKAGKPVYFTEIGYKSTTGDYVAPGDFNINNGVNLTEQANEYQALFSYWNNVSFLKGISIWDWKPYANAGGPNDSDYTPQGKPSEQIMASWFGNSASTAPVTPPPATHKISATAQVASQSVSVGTPEAITANISNGATGAETGLVIDIEVYDASGAKVLQKTFENESIPAGTTKSYAVSFTPASAGTYKMKVGVFNSGWAQNLAWNDSAASFAAGAAQPAAPQHISFNASAINSSGAPGTSLSYGGDVTDTGDAISGTLVDFEVYDSSNHQVAQNVASNVSFAAGEKKHYSYSFTPGSAGTYRIAVGVFSNDWTKNYLWTNSAGTIIVGSGLTGSTPPPTTPPPSSPPPTAPVSSVIDVWWPTSGSTISGVTPFQGLVEGLTLGSYTMYWQVDGGVLNQMNDSQANYPHKESLVDVSGWKWKGNGPYTLTFTAKGTNGQILATKSVNVTIAH